MVLGEGGGWECRLGMLDTVTMRVLYLETYLDVSLPVYGTHPTHGECRPVKRTVALFLW